MTRLYGYAPRNERLVADVPHGHYLKLTFVAGLTTDGLIAPHRFVGSMNEARFLDYIQRVLAPATRPGDLLILDNLSSHKTAKVRRALSRRGIAVQYLPPFSPDLNPIEMAFSKLKRLARTAAARTLDALQVLVDRLATTMGKRESRNCIKHAGYLATQLRRVL
jgi:transposase